MTVRPAGAGDVPFIDQLQKMHSHMVGWMPAKQIEGKIAAGHVVIAEDERERLGYCISQDRYMGRDDVGIVYQLNVLPLRQRNLVGASLMRAVFERSAYGCRLFSCWCAQDIQANWFWESIGFIPLAFRTGSASKLRTHIFWQRRVREGDATTPYWFPSQTGSGAIREDRLVVPIPPGTHWRDPMPMLLPGVKVAPAPEIPRTLPGGAAVRPRPEQPKYTRAEKAAIQRSQSSHLKGVPLGRKAVITAGGIRYVDRTDYVPELDGREQSEPPKPKREPRPRVKHDPKQIAAARELRDRWLEHVNTNPEALAAGGKYAVGRVLPSPGSERAGAPVASTVAALALPAPPMAA